MQALEFLSPQVRRARIEYSDTSNTNRAGEADWTVTRNAMILDDVEVIAERLGGRALKEREANKFESRPPACDGLAGLRSDDRQLGLRYYAGSA